MRYKVGAEQLQQVPSLVHRRDGAFRAARTAPVGPTHAVCAAAGVVVCGIKAEALVVLNEDWEAAAGPRDHDVPLLKLLGYSCRAAGGLRGSSNASRRHALHSATSTLSVC